MLSRCLFHRLDCSDDVALKCFPLFRVKTIIERLRVAEKLSCFEITAFFMHCVKEAVISKQESFSTTLSRSYIFFTLGVILLDFRLEIPKCLMPYVVYAE